VANKTAVIFGANGQDGFYLDKLLCQERVEVIKISRSPGSEIITGDVADYKFVENILQQHKPGYVFHFAANSTARHTALFENFESIDRGTLNILESVKLHSPDTKVFLSGSALQFKNTGQPIDEQTEFDPSSAYSVSRIHSVYAGRYFRTAFGLKVYVGYFFHHDSPLRSERHVNQKIVKAVKRIREGSKEKLTLGDIRVRKEFNYAGDVVDAIWKLVNQETIFEAVIGSGKAYTIQDWVEYCFSIPGLNWRDHVILEEGFVSEYDILVSNPRLIKSIGWEPKANFFELATLMLNE
jgi:GDPmannose 4,6-dehydratase